MFKKNNDFVTEQAGSVVENIIFTVIDDCNDKYKIQNYLQYICVDILYADRSA